MKLRRSLRLLAALAFLLGQWLTLVHATAHELTPGSQTASCEICAVANSPADAPALPAVFLAPPEAGVAAPFQSIPSAAACPQPKPPARGPPSFLV